MDLSNVGKLKRSGWALALIGAAIGLATIRVALQPNGHVLAGPSVTQTAQIAPQSSFLYRFDPTTLSFYTHTLPVGSLPADVAVTGTAPVNIWVTLSGSHKIGHLVFTNTAETAWTEYAITSTANSRPFRLALNGNDVWFTEQGANRVGRLNALTGQIDEFYGNGLSPNSGLADLDIAPDGSVWLAGQSSNRLIRLVITSTIDYMFQEYSANMPNGPFGIAAESNSRIHFTAPLSDRVGFLTPATGAVVLASGIVTGPTDIVWDPSNAAVWFSEPRGNSVGFFFFGTLGIPAQFGPIPRPVGLSRVSGNTLWITQQDNLGQLARLVYTTTDNYLVSSYPLPTAGLHPTGVSLAGDNAIWLAAYVPGSIVYMPLLARNYSLPSGPFAVQLYGAIDASTGFEHAAAASAAWIRYPVRWSEIEPVNTTPPNYDWAALDVSIQEAIGAGVKLILTLESNPAWAAASSRGPVYDINQLKEFVGALVARYPDVLYWEIYNEPDNIVEGYGDNGVGYAATLNALYPVIKSANPFALVVLGGVGLDWFDWQGGTFDAEFLDHLLQSCVQPCFDVANFHYYPVFRGKWEQYGHDIIGKANYLRQKLAQYGYYRPVINTETGWSASIWGDPAIQARYVPKTYVRGMAANMPLINWYAMVDADPSLPGLLGGGYPNYQLRPAYDALRRLTAFLGRAQFVRALSRDETDSPFIEGYVFSVPGLPNPKRIDVVWFDCPSLHVDTPNLPEDCEFSAPFHVPAARIGVIDHLTGPLVILNDGDDGNVDGWVTLPGGVNTNPIYIDYNPE